MEPEHFEALYPDETRFKEVEKILGFVKEGNSCQLVGVSGTGRSNVLGLLAYNRNVRVKHLGENQKLFHFVLINFSEIRKKPLLEATKFIFLNLLDSLRERQMKEEYEIVNNIFKESIVINDDLVIFAGLKKTIDFLALEKNLTVVLLFDRFEEYIPMLNSSFFSNLRILRNRAKYHFSVVFSTNRPLEDCLEPTLFSDFYEFMAGKIIYLPIFDKTGLDFRISYLEKITGKKIEKKIIQEVLSLTGGHGSLTRFSLEAILANEKNVDLTNFLLSQKSVRSALFGIWNSLNPSEQNLLALLNFEGQDILSLENIGLINSNKLTIPLLKDYVLEKNRLSAENEKIVFDQDTNEIKKGEFVVSDKLTSSELRLLHFLLQNSNKILSREEIINAVWKDVESIAGVSDQALDQLIFRLRKKIETNPNSPTYIHTVKGRGLKFSS